MVHVPATLVAILRKVHYKGYTTEMFWTNAEVHGIKF